MNPSPCLALPGLLLPKMMNNVSPFFELCVSQKPNVFEVFSVVFGPPRGINVWSQPDPPLIDQQLPLIGL
jgi:hypothetical protein